jgi:hypothetical protein
MKNVVFWDVTLVRTDVSEERISSIVRVTRIDKLGTLAVTSNRSKLGTNNISLVTLMKEEIRSSETSVPRNISEGGILLINQMLIRKIKLVLTDALYPKCPKSIIIIHFQLTECEPVERCLPLPDSWLEWTPESGRETGSRLQLQFGVRCGCTVSGKVNGKDYPCVAAPSCSALWLGVPRVSGMWRPVVTSSRRLSTTTARPTNDLFYVRLLTLTRPPFNCSPPK